MGDLEKETDKNAWPKKEQVKKRGTVTWGKNRVCKTEVFWQKEDCVQSKRL